MQVYLACGYTDMRKGMATLAMLVQQTLGHDPFSGAVYAFRGRRGGLIKVLWHDGVGMCLFIKRLERGQFVWPMSAAGIVALTAGQLVHAARSCMLMPLLVRLTDSEVEAIDGVVPQVSDCIEDGSGVLEEVSSSRLSIDEQALLPDLHIDPIHGDI